MLKARGLYATSALCEDTGAVNGLCCVADPDFRGALRLSSE
jgi:hypothetical protein